MRDLRIFVLSGWFGQAFSPGMASLSDQLKRYGTTSYHDWNDINVLHQINHTDNTKHALAVIGFSLGANQLGWIDQFANRRIELGVAYDPSKQSPLVHRSGNEYFQTVHNYDRLICYYHPGAWVYGGSRYDGSHVETVLYNNTPHLLLQFASDLHARTIREVELLYNKNH